MQIDRLLLHMVKCSSTKKHILLVNAKNYPLESLLNLLEQLCNPFPNMRPLCTACIVSKPGNMCITFDSCWTIKILQNDHSLNIRTKNPVILLFTLIVMYCTKVEWGAIISENHLALVLDILQTFFY